MSEQKYVCACGNSEDFVIVKGRVSHCKRCGVNVRMPKSQSDAYVKEHGPKAEKRKKNEKAEYCCKNCFGIRFRLNKRSGKILCCAECGTNVSEEMYLNPEEIEEVMKEGLVVFENDERFKIPSNNMKARDVSEYGLKDEKEIEQASDTTEDNEAPEKDAEEDTEENAEEFDVEEYHTENGFTCPKCGKSYKTKATAVQYLEDHIKSCEG